MGMRVDSEDVLTRARAIHEEAEEFNRFTWHGPLRDSLEEAMQYVWRIALEKGYREGCEDSQ